MHFSIGIGSAIVFFAGLELWLRHEAAQSDETLGGEVANREIQGAASGNQVPGTKLQVER